MLNICLKFYYCHLFLEQDLFVLFQLPESNPVYLEHYGDILFLKGNKDNAVVQWQKAKEAGNGSEKLIKKIHEKKYFK